MPNTPPHRLEPLPLEHVGDAKIDLRALTPKRIDPMPDLPADEIDTLTPEQLDPVTKDDQFRNATLLLLDGKITVEDWLDAAADAINRQLDIPWLPEAIEQSIFRYSLKMAGKILHGFLRGGSENAPTPSPSHST